MSSYQEMAHGIRAQKHIGHIHTQPAHSTFFSEHICMWGTTHLSGLPGTWRRRRHLLALWICSSLMRISLCRARHQSWATVVFRFFEGKHSVKTCILAAVLQYMHADHKVILWMHVVNIGIPIHKQPHFYSHNAHWSIDLLFLSPQM